MKLSTQRVLTDLENEAAHRIKCYGPPPTNKFQQLRTSRILSLEQLGREAFIDPSGILRCEQGQYTNPLPSLMDYWVFKSDETHYTLLNDYEDFQDHQRGRHVLYFGETLNVSITSPLHPLKQLRGCRPHLISNQPTATSLEEMSKALCLPVDTLQFFEKKYKSQQSVPKNLKAVLNQIGYSTDEVAEFERIYKEWRKLQLATVAKVTFS